MSKPPHITLKIKLQKYETEIQKGFLIHLFRGDDNEAEFMTLRRACMRYGIQAWDIMHSFLPWKSRAELRSTLCKIIGKQAISEFKDIHADPFVIAREIEKEFQNAPDGQYIKKGGVIVNQKFGVTDEERAEILENNRRKFDMKSEDSVNVNVPTIMKIGFLQEKALRRRVAQIIFRAALVTERARRRGEKPQNLHLDEISIVSGKDVRHHRHSTELTYTRDTEDVLLDCEPIIS